MKKSEKEKMFDSLPGCAVEFIKLVIKKMRYRKKVRSDVQAELIAHFDDELRECKTDEEKQAKAEQLIAEFGDVKTLGRLLRRAKKRCRPLWRTIVARIFQTIGVLILCFIVYCIYISLGKPNIGINYVEEATRFVRPVVDENLNAASLYQKAIDKYKEIPQIKSEKYGRVMTESTLLTDALKKKNWLDDLKDDEISALKEWISDNADAIEFFKQAVDKPYCWWHRKAKDNIVLNVLMPELSGTRKLAKMIVWQAKLKAYNGDIEGAFEDLLACYKAGTHLMGPRSLIEQLVGVAIRSLAARNMLIILENREIESQLLKSLQDKFDGLISESVFIVNYRVERFYALDFIQRCYTDTGRGSGHMIPDGIKDYYQSSGLDGIANDPPMRSVLRYGLFVMMSVACADRDKMNREFEGLYKTCQEWGYKTPWQLREENVDFELGLGKWTFLKRAGYWPIQILMPALGKVHQISWRVKNEVEATLTIMAILRYTQVRGAYPDGLDELVSAGFLQELPIDPFSDKPLVYKKTDDGFTLYSVGLNFEDDGGEVYREDDGRVRLWHDKESDAVFWPVPKSETPEERDKRLQEQREFNQRMREQYPRRRPNSK